MDKKKMDEYKKITEVKDLVRNALQDDSGFNIWTGRYKKMSEMR